MHPIIERFRRLFDNNKFDNNTEEVRAEIWRLGARHLGWPLEGALDELKTPGIAPGRARLLRACVRKLQHQ